MRLAVGLLRLNVGLLRLALTILAVLVILVVLARLRLGLAWLTVLAVRGILPIARLVWLPILPILAVLVWGLAGLSVTLSGLRLSGLPVLAVLLALVLGRARCGESLVCGRVVDKSGFNLIVVVGQRLSGRGLVGTVLAVLTIGAVSRGRVVRDNRLKGSVRVLVLVAGPVFFKISGYHRFFAFD